jgi:hypothetical protein
MAETFLGAVFRFATKRSFVRSDQLAVFAGLMVPAAAKMWGRESMRDDLFAYVAMAILIGIAGMVILRFVTAPYFVWREQKAITQNLKDELARPETAMRTRITDDLADTRIRLAERLILLHHKLGEGDHYIPEFYWVHLKGEETGVLVGKLRTDSEFWKLWQIYFNNVRDEGMGWPSAKGPKGECPADIVSSYVDVMRYLQFKRQD